MTTIGIGELASSAGSVIDEVVRTGRPTLVTRHGRTIAALVAVDDEALLDHVLATAPEYIRSMTDAETDIARGERGRSLETVLAELETAH